MITLLFLELTYWDEKYKSLLGVVREMQKEISGYIECISEYIKLWHTYIITPLESTRLIDTYIHIYIHTYQLL